ncbi:MAG: magnesium chelatase ATPase subunit [Pseudomonadota bacterium]|jgi:magnesium chelatase subunit D
MQADGVSQWADALLAIRIFALDPACFGGVLVRSGAGPVRDRWLTHLRASLAEGAPVRKIPCNIEQDRLLGGLDLTATLAARRPVELPGVLTQIDGGVLILATAERLASGSAASISAVMDAKQVAPLRYGYSAQRAACFGVVALDEGEGVDERLPDGLADRLAFVVDLTAIGLRDTEEIPLHADGQDSDVLPLLRSNAQLDDELTQAVCATAVALGVSSLRAPIHACRTARALAALEGRDDCTQEDVITAVRLTLVPRATCLPPTEQQVADEQPQSEESVAQPQQQGEDPSAQRDQQPKEAQPLDDVITESARAAIPAGLLSMIASGAAQLRSAGAAGRAGAIQSSKHRGRPIGARAASSRHGVRLNALATLRAAAPWQAVRRRARPSEVNRIHVRPEDFRVTRYAQRAQTTTIFALDASGSAALHRLAEAKGAVELLLAQCYVRRDEVAVIAFRGQRAELLLPPTRSLARAKRCLSGLPGGGATPLAAGIDAAVALTASVRRKGATPTIVLLTDGRANMARDGVGGRARAQEDALHAARQVRAARVRTILVDTSPQPQVAARDLAAQMAAHYLPLPYADARSLNDALSLMSQGSP